MGDLNLSEMRGKIFTLKIDTVGHHFTGLHDKDGPVLEARPYKVGDKVKVVMVSRFGDCGITHDLSAVNGYETRVSPDALEEI